MVPSCAEGGVLGVLCASIGSIQVNEAIKLLTGIGEPLVGKLMIYDALEMEYRKLKVRKDPNCALCGDHPTVTELIDYETFCGAVSDEAADAAAGATISVIQLEHMLKDVGLCLDEARAAGAPFPFAALARELYSAGVGRGLGEQDFAAVLRVLEDLGGAEL